MQFKDLTVGLSAEFSKTITEADVMMYAEITGDFNPVHVDPVAAASTRFKGQIAHGLLSAGLISAAIANKLPGPGAIYLGQTLKFTKPVRLGETVTAAVAVVELMSRNRVRLSTTCRNQDGETVIEGEATVMVDE